MVRGKPSNDISSLPDGEQFIYEGTTRIKTGALISMILSVLYLVWSAGVISFVDMWIGIHVWIITGTGEFLARLIGMTIGTGAAIQAQAWATALADAAQYGPFAPFLMVADALIVTGLVALIWDRRPF